MGRSMTSRERLMAAIRHEEPDTVPISPRIWAWLLEYYGESGWLAHLKAAKEFDFDPIIQLGSPASNYIYYPIGDYLELRDVEVKIEIRREGEFVDIRREIKTPAGALRDRIVKAKPGGIYGISPNPERREPLVKDREDLERLRYLLPEPSETKVPDYDGVVEIVGNRGLVEVRPHSGVDHILVDAMGIDNAMVAYYEDRELFRGLLSLAHEFYKGLLKACLERGVGMIFESWYNCSIGAGWSPKIWRDEFLPLMREDVDLVHGYGALFHFYDDGKIMPVIRDLADAGVDILSTLCPPPMGDVDLSRAKSEVGDRICLLGYCDLQRIKEESPDWIRD
ncbi:MAG: uroporphyrinogen decarboxylase family protein [bacterium]